MAVQLIKVTATDHWKAYHHIRRLVFYELRGRAGYDPEHPDEHHSHPLPLLLLQNALPVGTVRLDLREGHRGIVRMVAILPSHQRQGLGGMMMAALVSIALENGANMLAVYADPGAVGFYEKLGWMMIDANSSSLMMAKILQASLAS